MASLNKIQLIGNLGRDPEVRSMNDGATITNITVATTSTWKNKSGEKQEETEWHKVAFFGKLAEIAGEYLKKGSSVYIEGKLKTRKWQDKEGNDKYTTEVIADAMQMLGGRTNAADQSESRSNASPRTPSAQQIKGSSKFDDMEDSGRDIPF